MGVFDKLFGKYLLVTNMVSCGLLMGAGDALQQRTDFMKKHMPKMSFEKNKNPSEGEATQNKESAAKNEEKKEYDYRRTRNMMIVGLGQGSFSHFFYSALERRLPSKSLASLMKKTLMDQTVASPICICMFYFGLGALESKSIKEIHEELRLKWLDIWKVDCMFWPPVQIINFLFVPLHYRVIYTSFMEIIYDIFLSYVKHDVHYNLTDWSKNR